MKRVLFFYLLLCTAAAFGADSIRMPRFEIPTARSNGMGGAHVAYTDTIFGLLVNPAAIMQVQEQSSFAFSPTLFSPQSTFDLISPFVKVALDGNFDDLGNAADVLSKRKGKIPLGFDLREFPLSIAWVANGFGFGLWNRVFVNPSIVGANVIVNVYADIVLPVGFAFKILDTETHRVDAGITVKPFLRAKVEERVSITDLMDDSDTFIDNLRLPLIAGAGVDLGFMYRWDMGFSAGLTFSDIVSRGKAVVNFTDSKDTSSYYVPFSLNLGAAYDLKIGTFWKTAPPFLANTGLAFTVDWRDVTNIFQQKDYLNHRNALLDLSVGMEINMLNLIIVRAGMNEMLPAVGLGINLGSMQIDLAYYGKEFGLEPGLLSGSAVDLTVAIRPGVKKRDWPWTQHSLVELFTGTGESGEREERSEREERVERGERRDGGAVNVYEDPEDDGTIPWIDGRAGNNPEDDGTIPWME